jgi:pimeloyl-ACP methyl ester carboxylesterase
VRLRKTNTKRAFSVLLIVFLIMQSLSAAAIASPQKGFKDLPKYQKEIGELVELGIINGYPDNTFRPNLPITRMQAVTMIAREMQLDTKNRPNPNFKDVKKGQPGYDAIAAAVAEGIISGKADGNFDPQGKLSRAEMAKILVKAYSLKSPATYSKKFKDVPKTYWAHDFIQAIAANEITTGYGDGTFRPGDHITRLQFSLFLSRYINGIKKGEMEALSQKFTLTTSKSKITYGEKVTLKLEAKDTKDLYYTANWSATAGNLNVVNDKNSAEWTAAKNNTQTDTIIVKIEATSKGKKYLIEKTAVISVEKLQETVATDSDADGLSNEQERELGTDPAIPDTDGDQLKDGEEVNTYKTNPLHPDTDSDGLSDYFEVQAKMPAKFDPLKPDSDGNKVPDGAEDYDQDKLINVLEEAAGTNPLNPDTDGDKLADSYEVLYLSDLSPLKPDTDEDGIPDPLEDFDGDGLTTIMEQQYQTNPLSDDTDGDGLKDQEEIGVYKTNPTLEDTDNDQLDDGAEIKFKSNPLNPDTDGDGTIDGLEKREQTLESDAQNVQLTFAATGDATETTLIKEDKAVSSLVGAAGVVGKPIDITTSSQFDSATLTVEYDASHLNGIQPENLRIFYFNPKTNQLELVENQQVNTANSTVSATLTHFSTYVLGDLSLWAKSWEENTKNPPAPGPGGEEEKPLDLVLVIDSSGSMSSNDPDDYRLSGAKQVIDSLKEGDQVAVVGDRGAVVDFDSWAQLLQELTEDKDALKEAVDKIDSSGGTDIAAGVTVGLAELEKNGREDADKAIILLTDGEGYYTHALTTKAQQMGVKITTIGLGEYIDFNLLQKIADDTGGDFYHVEAAEDLEIVLERSKDQIDNDDTDGDGLPDWVEKLAESNGGFILKNTFHIPFTDIEIPIENKFVTKFDMGDTDGDEVNDADELGGLSNIYVNSNKTKVYLKEYPQSNPNNADTDGDTDNDKYDDKPLREYIKPVVLLHGIRSNTGDTWGGDAWLDNGNLSLFAGQDEPDFTKDVPSYLTATKTAYSKGHNLTYNHLDAQYIKEVRANSLARHLEMQGYDANESIYVFNWENMDHVLYAAQHLETYLENLMANYLPSQDVDVTKGYSQETSFSLVGHSAGGLVSRTYIETLQDSSDPRIDNLVTVDTPHYGSDYLNNGGICGLVTEDLDREDSDLFYSNPSSWCSDYGQQKLNSDNKGSTNYYFFGGLIGRYYEMVDDVPGDRVPPRKVDKYYIPSDKAPIMLTFGPQGKSKTDDQLFSDIQRELGQHGITVPDKNKDVLSEKYFGDNIVTIGSQLGIPADFQRENEEGVDAVSYDQAFVVVGRSSHSSHSDMTKLDIVYQKIAELIKN